MNIKDWIKKNLDKDQIKDVVEYGCVNGTVSELIYYSDTSAFHDAHEEEIWQMVWESAEEHGQTVLEFLATLRRRACRLDVSTKKSFGLVRC